MAPKRKASVGSQPSAKKAKVSGSAKKADKLEGSKKTKTTGSADKSDAANKTKKSVKKADIATKKEKPSDVAEQAEKSSNAPKQAKKSTSQDSHFPVDSLVPGSPSYKVVSDCSCTLNQTNIGDNNNKFYLIQLLRDTHGMFSTWNRWGRVGEPGQSKMSVFDTDFAAAEKDFCKKFMDKTRNAWTNRNAFKAVPGKYTLVEMDAKTSSEDTEADAPLGKLSEAQIHKGSAVLKELSAVLASKSKPSEVERLSGKFYSLIPHVFGRQRPPPIDKQDVVEEKKALLEFYLRMGFSGIEAKNDPSPIPGVLELVPPKSLQDAIGGRNLCDKWSIDSANATGASCYTKKAGSPLRHMPPHLYAAIVLYTGNSIYRDLNTSLRERKLVKCASYKPYVRSLIEAAECLPPTTTSVWRGLSVDLYNQYTVGMEMTWWQVSSCTSNKQVALNFASNCGSNSTLLTIHTKSARNISCVTFYPNEQENILLPGTRIKVSSKERKGKMTCITLQETGSAL